MTQYQNRTGIKSSFEQIAESSNEERFPMPTKGKYKLAVKELKYIPNGHRGESFVFLFDVLEHTGNENPMQKGESIAVPWNLQNVKARPFKQKEIKFAIAAILNKPVEQIDAGAISACVSDDQPVKGAVVNLNVYPGERLADNGEPYLERKFFPAK